MKDRHKISIMGIGPRGPKAYRPQYQLHSLIWTFNAYDPDFYPSVPHGHSGKYKLNVYTGAIIDTTTKLIVGFLDKKEMKRLFSDIKFLELEKKAKQYYLTMNPGASLPVIGSQIRKTKRVYNILNNRQKNYITNYKLINQNKMITKKLNLHSSRESVYYFKTIVKTIKSNLR